MNIEAAEKKYWMLISLIIYKIVLDLSYVYYINPVYEYTGFTYDLNWWKLLESYIFVSFISIWLPQNELNPSTIAVNVLNILMIIPIFSIYALKNESTVYAYGILISFFITIVVIKLLPKIPLKINFLSKKILFTGLLAITVLVYGSLVYFNGLPSLELLDFNKVYNVRGTVNYGHHIMTYLVPWQGNVINIFLMLVAWKHKNKAGLFIVICLQVLLYLLTSHKAIFFYPIVICFLMYFIKRKKLVFLSIYGVVLVIIGSLFLFYSNISQILPAMFVNRTLFLPAQISFQYYEFFSQNGLVFLSHSILSKFFSTPIYELHPIRVIGEVYYTNNWPNTGYLGDAYMNFGIVGMIIFSMILGTMLKIFDSLANTEEKHLISGAFMVIFMVSFTNGALLTNLLTGGMLFYMLILWLYNDENITTCNKTLSSRDENSIHRSQKL